VERYTIVQLIVVAYNDILVYHAEGTYDIAVSQFSLWVDYG
jgi:hypothetical protein